MIESLIIQALYPHSLNIYDSLKRTFWYLLIEYDKSHESCDKHLTIFQTFNFNCVSIRGSALPRRTLRVHRLYIEALFVMCLLFWFPAWLVWCLHEACMILRLGVVSHNPGDVNDSSHLPQSIRTWVSPSSRNSAAISNISPLTLLFILVALLRSLHCDTNDIKKEHPWRI